MSMLYTELLSIYEKKVYLSKNKSLEEFHFLLRSFLVTELKKQTIYFNPYKFAYLYTMNHKTALNFFLAVSNTDSIFKKYYAIECDCGSTYIEETLSPEMTVYCDECYEQLKIYSNSSLGNITILFKLNSAIKEEIKNDLKFQSSSNTIIQIEEGAMITEPTVNDIIENQDKNLVEIDLESSRFAEGLRYALSRN